MSNEEKLQALYDAEINFKIECFWDGGFDVKSGDDMNGIKAEDNFRRLEDAVSFLENEARKIYPDYD